MEFLNFKKNPYFALVVLNHSGSFDIRDQKFKESLISYLTEYVESHWAVITDYLSEKSIDKEELFEKSFEDFKFTSNYLNTFFMGFIDDEFSLFIDKVKEYLAVPETTFYSTKDYYINEAGDKIIRIGPFDLFEQKLKMTPEAARILFLVNYNEWFLDKLKQAYVHHESP